MCKEEKGGGEERSGEGVSRRGRPAVGQGMLSGAGVETRSGPAAETRSGAEASPAAAEGSLPGCYKNTTATQGAGPFHTASPSEAPFSLLTHLNVWYRSRQQY